MSNIGVVAPQVALPATRAADDAATPTADQETVATEFPAGSVQLERTGPKTGLRISGGLLATGGAALLGISLLSRGGAGAIESRLRLSSLLLGGGLVGTGAASVLGAELLPTKTKFAIATKLPTEARAREIAATFTDRRTSIVRDVTGSFAVIDEGPRAASNGSGYSGNGHYYGDGHYHGHHYVGDGHNHGGNFYPDPYYPGSGNYYPDPYYPTPSNGNTGRGDDYSPSYPSYPSNPGGSNTGRGDDGGSSYDPPSYDPPSYDPPSYDPPSYDPPSYDPPSYDPPSHDSGDSSSNGNPSYDDF